MAALLLINQIVSYVTVSFYVVKPTIEQVNLMLAKQIKTVFIDWEDGVEINDEVSEKFFEITGIEVMTQREASYRGSIIVSMVLVRQLQRSQMKSTNWC